MAQELHFQHYMMDIIMDGQTIFQKKVLLLKKVKVLILVMKLFFKVQM